MGLFRRCCNTSRKLQRSILAEHVWKDGPKKVIALSAKDEILPKMFPSNAGHVEPGMNSGGPPPKAKYEYATDSVEVARVNGEKYPC